MESGSQSIEAARERARRIASALVRDPHAADDVAQEAALRIVQGRFRPRRSFAGSLAAMVRHLVSNGRRGEQRRRHREADAGRNTTARSPAQLLAQAEAQERLWAHVRALAEPARTVVLLRYVEGLPPRRIAKQLDLPLETVKSRLKRGLATLRARMDASHGDRRDAWLALLLPFAQPHGLVEGASVVGGTLVKANAVKRTAIVVTALLAVGGLTWGVIHWKDAGAGSSDPKPVAGTSAPGKAPAPALATAGVDVEPSAPRPTVDIEPDETSTESTPTRKDPFSVPSIVRQSPFGLPKRPGGGRKVKNANGDWIEIDGFAGGGLTGHRTGLPVGILPKGRATLTVSVVDVDGVAVGGARVLLGPTKLAGVEGISYGDMKRFDKIPEDGVLTLEALPAGSVAVGADFNNRLAGRRGYDGRHMVATVLEDDRTTEVTVRLPFAVAKTGTIRGRLLQKDGKPVAGGQAYVHANHQWVKGDGTFVLEGVPQGEQTLKIRVWEFQPIDHVLTIRPGQATEVSLTLEPNESGDIALRGTVVGPEGDPVARAYVYLSSDTSTIRTVRTDADGRFEMRDLPEHVKTDKYRLQGSGFPRVGTGQIVFEEGLDRSEVRLVLKPRFVDLVLDIRDLSSDEPVVYASIEAKVEGEERVPGFHRQKNGRFKTMMPVGARVNVSIHALDHKDQQFVLDVPTGKEEHVHTVKMVRTNPDSVEVALVFTLRDAATDAPIPRVKITVLERTQGRMISAFDGRRDEGVVRMPGWSGSRHVRFEAEGYETLAMPLTVPADEAELAREIRLRPR